MARHGSRTSWLLALAAIGCLWAQPSRAQGTYYNARFLLKAYFSSSDKVGYVSVTGSELRAYGLKAKRPKYVVFVAFTDGRVDGYAVIDEEKGQHLPITFGTKLGPDGRVLRSEVMVYREGYGHEIREKRFRDQFRGVGPGDPIRLGVDIDSITGATISAHSMAAAIRRAVQLVAIVRAREGQGAETAAAVP